MINQCTASFEQLVPASELEKKLKSSSWSTRKEMYEQILYLLQEHEPQPTHSPGELSQKLFEIGGKLYAVKKLIPFFEDIIDEEHPGVLIAALTCVQTMIQKSMCSGREFVRLIDQGFDKFPLKINKGKEIMQKFADIIEKIGLEPQFVLKKLTSSVHEKCTIFTLEVAGMLGMTQLLPKLKEIANKHPKSAVREVAIEICSELQELSSQNQSHHNLASSQEYKAEKPSGVVAQSLSKAVKSKSRRKTPTKSDGTSLTTFNKAQQQILQKVSQFQQLKSSKDQQNYSENLMELFRKYFKAAGEGKVVPPLPLNQLTNLSYIVRLMVESNNAIISTNGLKILKLLIQHNCAVIPRSFPLLFIFDKFRLHATHQINQLLYELCDSLLLCNSLSTTRNTDLMQAAGEGANNKKANVKYGSFMVFLRAVSILYKNHSLFKESFLVGEALEEDGDKALQVIMRKVNEGDVDRIKAKLYKQLTKCLQSFALKMGEDKKYDEKLQEIKITMSVGYGKAATSTQSVVSSMESLRNKTIKKTLSHMPQFDPAALGKVKASSAINIGGEADEMKKTGTPSVRGQNSGYRIVNPEQKLNKILKLCSNPCPSTLSLIKKLVLQSLVQFQECIEEQRFQLFYFSEVLDNFTNSYDPCDETTDIISQYLLQVLLRVSNIKAKNNSKFLLEGLGNILRMCLCTLVLGEPHLLQILDNLALSSGIKNIISALLMVDQAKRASKVKKKNRKIVLEWLDSNVPAEELTDQLFELMEKIQKGESLGSRRSHQDTVKIAQQRQSDVGINLQKKITFSELNTEEGVNKEPEVKHSTFEFKKKLSLDERGETGSFKRAKEPQNQQILENRFNQFESQKSGDFRQAGVAANPSAPPPPFEGSQISRISYDSDHSVFGLGPTDRELDNNLVPKAHLDFLEHSKKQLEDDEGVHFPTENGRFPLEGESRYEQYYAKFKSYKGTEFGEEDQQQPHFGNAAEGKHNESESNSVEQEDGVVDIECYKEYIKKIRQTYLPQEYINQKQHRLNPDSRFSDPNSQREKQIEQSMVPSHKTVQVGEDTKKPKQQASQTSEEGEVEAEETMKFQYRMLNVNKLNYMIKTASNPYSHLQKEIIQPFKQSKQQQYFLKEISLYLTSLPEVAHPQPYNSLLLVVILLFSEIHANRNLISPLQELYEHLASLVSTNEFLRIIMSLFHSVIEETPTHLRTFLITILTKSVARLMPFCEDPVELLRDLSQFYNIGENVYFEMYEREYDQICAVVEGEALYDVVERALVQEKDNLTVIVGSWFETKLKSKIQQYIRQIVEENSEDTG